MGSFMANFEEKKELNKLKKIVKSMPPERRKLAEGLVDDAAFMVDQLSILKDEIRENGCSEEYQHGANQSGLKQSVAMTTYLQLQKSYSVTIRALEGFLPKEDKKQNNDDELLDFLTKR